MQGVRTRLGIPVLAAAAALLVAGCETPQQREMAGTIVGGAAGGLAGAQIGRGTGRVVATGVGAVAGAIIGREIARGMGETGQQAMAESAHEAARTGDSVPWHDPDSGHRGIAEVVSVETREVPVEITIDRERVDRVPVLELIGQTYVADGASNIRSGPGVDNRAVGTLQPGDAVHVVGRARNTDWMLVSRGGPAAGFVSARLLRVTTERTPAAVDADRPARVITVTAVQTCSTTRITRIAADGTRTGEEQLVICDSPDGLRAV